MPFHNTVLYQNSEGATFDMDYYLKTHMPLVGREFGKHGLKGWSVLKFAPGPDGTKPQYSVQATLIWDSPDQLLAALNSPEKDKVFGDVPNFSNVGPELLGGEVMGTS